MHVIRTKILIFLHASSKSSVIHTHIRTHFNNDYSHIKGDAFDYNGCGNFISNIDVILIEVVTFTIVLSIEVVTCTIV